MRYGRSDAKDYAVVTRNQSLKNRLTGAGLREGDTSQKRLGRGKLLFVSELKIALLTCEKGAFNVS